MIKNQWDEVLLTSGTTIPGWWNSSEQQIQAFLSCAVSRGKVGTILSSPGGREVKAVTYGEAEPELRGTANFNSAMGAKMPEAYFRRGPGNRKRPVMIILAGVHGQEIEGMMGAVSLVRIMETGKDIMGRDCRAFQEKMQRLRLIIIPLANPDGRVRVPYDGWCGLPVDEMTKCGQGTRKNGELYHWRPSKAVHPMKGDVGLLGAYFDDAGVNLMHDEWSSPMSTTASSLLRLVSEEGPDMLINLHGHSYGPEILGTEYVPIDVKKNIAAFARNYYSMLKKKGFKPGRVPKAAGEEAEDVPPAFNLQSMFYHVGMGFGFVFESPQGLTSDYYKESYSYEDIIDIHHILFECAADNILGEG